MTNPARKPLISGNWKMNLNHLEAITVVQKLAFRMEKDDAQKADVSVHPPFTALRAIQLMIDQDRMPLLLGAQNCHTDDSGAFTGEVSAPMLAKLNCALVIVGHSERRQHCGETDEVVNTKAVNVIKHGMTPIVCVGEPLEVREAGGASGAISHTTAQVRGSLARISSKDVAKLVIAYEPIWAIGTGRTALASDAQEMAAAIRAEVAEGWGEDAARGVRIQYGGSVKAVNAAELLAEPDVDGALVGGASLDPDEFARIAAFWRI